MPPADTLLDPAGSPLTYTYPEMVANILLAAVLGFILAWFYRVTHKGLSYSQSFNHTIVFVSTIVAIVMMVIGSSLARAFALVGALSIIRFRTVVKDTKDTAFIFAALAMGMAAGTSNYFLAVVGEAFVCLLALVLHRFNYGAVYKSEFILRFAFDQSTDSSEYLSVIQEHAKRSNMLHIEPSGDGASVNLTFDITLKDSATAESLTKELAQIAGLSEIALIVARNDVDYLKPIVAAGVAA